MSKCQQLIEYITQDIIAYIVEDTGLEIDEAMHAFYTSNLYEKLLDEETGLYLESSAYVYDIYKTEKQQGKLTQSEL